MCDEDAQQYSQPSIKPVSPQDLGKPELEPCMFLSEFPCLCTWTTFQRLIEWSQLKSKIRLFPWLSPTQVHTFCNATIENGWAWVVSGASWPWAQVHHFLPGFTEILWLTRIINPVPWKRACLSIINFYQLTACYDWNTQTDNVARVSDRYLLAGPLLSRMNLFKVRAASCLSLSSECPLWSLVSTRQCLLIDRLIKGDSKKITWFYRWQIMK